MKKQKVLFICTHNLFAHR